MNKMRYIVVILALTTGAALSAQDTVLNRNVTVEHAFQPVIQSAGKINQKPQVVEQNIREAEVSYSEYTELLSPDYNVNQLLSQPNTFRTPRPLRGEICAGVGHTGTLFDFHYTKQDKQKNYLKLYADHEACWGRKANEHTTLGFDFKHQFSAAELYFGVDGGNRFYTRYGMYANGEGELEVKHFSDMKDSLARQNAWLAGAQVGVRSRGKGEVDYDVRAAYRVYGLSAFATEQRARVDAKITWVGNSSHHAGMNMYAQGAFITANSVLPEGKSVNNRYALFMEPFYEYIGKRFMMHAGVNLDVVFGKGTMMAKKESDISFAPSPNIRFEAQIAPRWLTLYGVAKGSFSNASVEAAVLANPYMTITPVLYSHHVGAYTPVDGEVGFRIKAHHNLLLELHGGYAYYINQRLPYAVLNEHAGVRNGMLDYYYANMTRWKVGASVSYHYRDYVDIHVWGDYYGWKTVSDEFDTVYFPEDKYPGYFRRDAKRVYNKPEWALGARVDGRINSEWSLYTTLEVMGKRWAATNEKDVLLKPFVEWNIGAQYDWAKYNLTFFVQLNNLLCRKNDILYGYQTEEMNFLLGVRWRF